MKMVPVNRADSQDTGAKNDSVGCERCGSFEAMEIAGKILCPECTSLAGCGCAGDE